MAIDPDFACVVGVVTGQIAGVLSVWFGWGVPMFPPTLALIAVVLGAATVGAVCLGYLARKAAEMWLR